jgi:hypothetical protein
MSESEIAQAQGAARLAQGELRCICSPGERTGAEQEFAQL